MSYKVIVAHPGKQHSFRLATALHQAGMLDCYVTTIYDKESSLLMRLVKGLLKGDNLKRAKSRKNTDIADEQVILFCQLSGLIATVLNRIDRSRRIYRWYQNIVNQSFSLKVAKLAIRRKADAVVMYDASAHKGMAYLKKHAPHIKRIMDISIAARPHLKTIYQNEIKHSGNDTLMKENMHLWNNKMMRIFQAEIDDTQYFLAASNFVKQSLIACGVTEEQVLIAPYGANVSGECVDKSDSSKPLQLIFVGQVNMRKGIPHLLQAVSEISEEDIELRLVGSYNDQDSFVKQYKNKKNIHFEGMVTLDKMKQYYEQSEVFVIASLAEGMAQVGIEAMACGLPIICSTNSGVSDLITEGKEGFTVPVGDIPALKEKIEWFIHHRESIPQMSEAAHRIGKQYTWERYNEQVVACVRSIMETKPE